MLLSNWNRVVAPAFPSSILLFPGNASRCALNVSNLDGSGFYVWGGNVVLAFCQNFPTTFRICDWGYILLADIYVSKSFGTGNLAGVECFDYNFE